jgi:hypothetical protein
MLGGFGAKWTSAADHPVGPEVSRGSAWDQSEPIPRVLTEPPARPTRINRQILVSLDPAAERLTDPGPRSRR